VIYVTRKPEEPLYQGDIFTRVPLPEFSILEELPTPATGAIRWHDYASGSTMDPIPVVVELRPVTAMIISQDCEVARDEGSATMALVDRFSVIHRGLKGASNPNTTQKHITRLSRVNLQWFYLPADTAIGFSEKMATDFQTTIRLDVADVMSLRKWRIAGLNDYAREHLRHRISYFFLRYPVDEWYALDREEMEAYRKDGHAEAEPYPWQSQEED